MADKGKGGYGSKNPYQAPRKGNARAAGAKQRADGLQPKSSSTFNPYAAGKKHYGTGRSMPTAGKVGDMLGYRERDAKANARRDALIRRAGGK
jgi:hypothetical protein